MLLDIRKRFSESAMSEGMAQYRSDHQPIRFKNIYRGCKKYFILHIFVAAFVLYLVFTIGKGHILRFLPHMPFLQIKSDINALMYFDVNNDASKITWARATNSKMALADATRRNVDMIEGDVILQGQGTSQQKLMPVMGQPPQTNSDLTLEEWLEHIRPLRKGIKLDFSTIDSLEIALQRLKEFDAKHPIDYPVWIHANVLEGPYGDSVKVDPSRFFSTLKREFPKCTVSLGWTTRAHTDPRFISYTWDMVMDMYQLVKKWRIDDQPVVFEARLLLIKNSIPQLKWLCDNIPHSGLNVIHIEGDQVQIEDLMYIAYRFPPEGVFFDLNHDRFENFLSQYRHFSKSKVNPLVTKRDEVVFKPKAWVKMGYYIQKDSILPSTEAVVLTSPIVYIVTKSKYRPTSEIFIQGRVQFLHRTDEDAVMFETGLNIYLRPTAYAKWDEIVGIKCFLGVDGDVEVKGSFLPDNIPDFRKTARITPSAIRCFRFQIEDGGSQVIFKVSTVHECNSLESVVPMEDAHITLIVDIPHQLMGEPGPFILRLEDNNRQAVIDELSVKHKM